MLCSDIMTKEHTQSLMISEKKRRILKQTDFFFVFLQQIIKRMMKKGLLWLLVVGCWLSVVCCQSTDNGQETVDDGQLLITQIQQCSRLYTAEYQIHKIITHDDVLRLQGQMTGQDYDIALPVLGDRKIAIPMDATVKAYIDFGGFSEQNVERDGERITIILPDPKVKLTSTKIDHDNVKKYVALLRSDFTDDEISSYEQQGRAAILKAIPEMDIVESARKNAARILIPMIKQMGFSERNITITYRKDLNTQNIIERSTE